MEPASPRWPGLKLPAEPWGGHPAPDSSRLPVHLHCAASHTWAHWACCAVILMLPSPSCDAVSGDRGGDDVHPESSGGPGRSVSNSGSPVPPASLPGCSGHTQTTGAFPFAGVRQAHFPSPSRAPSACVSTTHCLRDYGLLMTSWPLVFVLRKKREGKLVVRTGLV